MQDGFTVGVEEEYQLVEPGTGELRSRAGVVQQADRTGQIAGEVQDTMLEIGTPICTHMGEVADALRERRFQASAAAAAEDLEILSVGVHPFSEWRDHALSEAERPRMLVGLFGQLLRQQHICGMHVHVAIPEELDRLCLMNVVRGYAPHLLALSCSSPYLMGQDTRFASFRAIMWRGFPFAGVPPRFASRAEYRDFMDLLLRGGVIPDERTVYWSVRPSPRYPTLELRMCDASPSIRDAVAMAALGRAIVVAAARGELKTIAGSLGPSLQDELLTENEWIAGRDGLEAVLIDPDAADSRMPVRRALAELLAQVGPIAEELGDGEAIRGVERILEHGNAADRMRERVRQGASFHELVDWLVQETRAGTGIDRRERSR